MSKVLGDKASHEPRRWEKDYQLVECEGLFEEYLEMGKFPFLCLIKTVTMTTQETNISNVLYNDMNICKKQ